jgi:SpoVK/Ycf46/Vps4 family AAA+-type ATPase
MPTDPTVIDAMAAAVKADPDNAALRLHLAGLLLDAGRADESLDHAAHVLTRQPDNLEALKKGADAAEAAGDKIRAAGYRRLHDGLSWSRTKSLLEGLEEPLRDSVEHEDPRDLDQEVDELESEMERWSPDEDDRIRLRSGGGYESEGAREGVWDVELSDLTLADVAGMEDVKRRLNIAFLAPMRNPDMMKLYGKSLRGGLLLYGPPGCGKTFIARAVAGELGAKFMAIGLSDVLDMYIGQSERNLHEIFETARRNRPCVLFFDEIDALGRKRSLQREHAGRDIVNQLLAEMDSVGANNDGVFILAATNHPWDVDTALRRPGRLDRTLLVLPPDAPARQAVVHSSLKERPTEGIDARWLAGQTEGFSGADMVHLCESAAEFAMEDSILSGHARPIRMADFKRALKEVRPSVRPWFDTARNYALFANEGGVYDDLLGYLRTQRML